MPLAKRLAKILIGLSTIILSACSGQPVSQVVAVTMAATATDTTLPPSPTVIPTATLWPTFTPAPSAVPGGLFVDAAQDLGPINPLVYGSNFGPWLVIPLGMQDTAKAAGLSVLRFPGGNWGDENDLGNYQVDQFMGLLKQLGAQAMINVRLKGGTAEQAAALVKYVNVTKQYNVRYWAIGNEPDLYKDYTIAQFNKDWRAWAVAMRAVDPTIKLIGPEVSQFIANPTDGYMQTRVDWVRQFLQTNGDMVDIVSIHRYPYPTDGNTPPTIANLRDNSVEWDSTVPFLRTMIRQYASRDLPVAVTEVNSSWATNSAGEATMDSHYNAIWWGDSLGRMIRQGVMMVDQFAVFGDYGLMNKSQAYPIYYVYKMYQQFGTERVYASSDNPNVSVFAARRTDGALTVLVVNLTTGTRTPSLTLANLNPPGSTETWLFDQTHKAEPVAATPLAATDTLTLSPESMTLYVIPKS